MKRLGVGRASFAYMDYGYDIAGLPHYGDPYCGVATRGEPEFGISLQRGPNVTIRLCYR